MKKTICKLLLIIVPVMLLFSCKKDDFTEKDALAAQQSINLSLTVVDATSSLAPVGGATVRLLKDSTIVTKTTNNDGTVVFPNVRIGGDAVVSVSKDQYTSVLTTVSTDPYSYRQTGVSELVSIYSLASGKTATIKGRLTMQSDLTDRNREPATGVVVKARNRSINSTTEQLFTATTDNDGNYAVSIPVSGSGDNIEIFYPEFTVNQKLAMVQDNNSIAVSERPVLYKSDVSPLMSIPSIPSIYATVAAPAVASGTGFSLGSKPNRVPLSFYSFAYLAEGGSGYNGGVTILNHQLLFSADPNGISAKLQVDIVNGKITNIDGIIDNGASYSVAPTLNLNVLSPATPAKIILNFQTTYKIYITNKGTNYSSFPQVSVETESFNTSTGVRVKGVDPNINDGSNSILGDTYLFNDYTVIYAGMIKGELSGDTLISNSTPFSLAPVFTVLAPVSKKAVLQVTTVSINTDSTLNSINIIDAGLGYNQTNPPAITLTSLAGYGTGAVVKATVTTAGSLSGTYVTNPGSKYVRNVNDYKKAGVTGATYDNPSYPNTDYYGVKSGDIIVQDVYYGTGYQVLNQNTGK